MCVCVYKSNKWWKMKLLAISMTIQNKQGGVCDTWGQKHKDAERDSLQRQRPSTTSFPLGRVNGSGAEVPSLIHCPGLSVLPSVLVLPNPSPEPGRSPRSLSARVPMASSGWPDRSSSQNVHTNTWKTRIKVFYPG